MSPDVERWFSAVLQWMTAIDGEPLEDSLVEHRTVLLRAASPEAARSQSVKKSPQAIRSRAVMRQRRQAMGQRRLRG